MTPEELNRTINFIIESQARLSAAQEQDRVDRVEFEKWAKGLMAQMMVDRQRTTELIEIQSRCVDRSEARLERAEVEDRAAQKRHDELQKRIFELLAKRPN
jgi:hypothetical protein